jgi:WhiB family redox-sensing transcriptional regulator
MRRWVDIDEALGSTALVDPPRPDSDESPITVSWSRYMPAWHSEAKCRSVPEWDEVFFGEGEDDNRASMNQDRVRRAQNVCHSCPVIRVCAQHALTQPEDHGVWAGTTAKMRERARDLITTGLMDLETVIDVILEGNAYAFKDFQASLSTGLQDVI